MSEGSPAPGVGASDLLSPLPPGAPPPMGRREAIDRLEALRRDPSFAARLERRDTDAVQESARLSQAISHIGLTAGNTVDPAAISKELVEATSAREMLDRENVVTAMRRQADIPDDVAAIIRNRTPITRAEKEMADGEKRRLFADAEWVKQYMSGNRAARSRMAIINIIAAAPTADPLPAPPGTTIDY
jgi:hypothetical protein